MRLPGVLDGSGGAGRRARQPRVAPGGLAYGALVGERPAIRLLVCRDVVVVIVGDDLEHALGTNLGARMVNRALDTLVGIDRDVVLARAVLVTVVRDHSISFSLRRAVSFYAAALIGADAPCLVTSVLANKAAPSAPALS